MDEQKRDEYLRLRIKAEGFRCNGTMIPAQTADALCAYAIYGTPPGGFLIGVLTNDLRETMISADPENLKVLLVTVCFVNQVLPFECHGSIRQVIEWLQKHAAALEAEEKKP